MTHLRLYLVLLMLALCSSSLAQFQWWDVEQLVRILSNGEVLVTDQRTLKTEEAFGEVFICVRLAPDQTLTLLEGSSLRDHEATSYQQECVNDGPGQEMVIAFEEPVQKARVRFRYRLTRAMQIYSDVVQWYWQILEQNHPPIRRYKLTVRAPGTMEAPYDAYVHRFSNPEEPTVVLSEDRSTLEVDFDHIPDGDGVEIRYLMDPDLFMVEGDEPGLEQLLQDEARLSAP